MSPRPEPCFSRSREPRLRPRAHSVPRLAGQGETSQEERHAEYTGDDRGGGLGRLVGHRRHRREQANGAADVAEDRDKDLQFDIHRVPFGEQYVQHPENAHLSVAIRTFIRMSGGLQQTTYPTCRGRSILTEQERKVKSGGPPGSVPMLTTSAAEQIAEIENGGQIAEIEKRSSEERGETPWLWTRESAPSSSTPTPVL